MSEAESEKVERLLCINDLPFTIRTRNDGDATIYTLHIKPGHECWVDAELNLDRPHSWDGPPTISATGVSVSLMIAPHPTSALNVRRPR